MNGKHEAVISPGWVAAGAPEVAPFMADECLLSMPGFAGGSIKYNMQEYLSFVDNINSCVERLNREGSTSPWTPHKVEQAIWTHYVAHKLQPELLDNIPPKSTGKKSKSPLELVEDSNGEVEKPSAKRRRREKE